MVRKSGDFNDTILHTSMSATSIMRKKATLTATGIIQSVTHPMMEAMYISSEITPMSITVPEMYFTHLRFISLIYIFEGVATLQFYAKTNVIVLNLHETARNLQFLSTFHSIVKNCSGIK